MTDIFSKLFENLTSGFPFAIYCKPGSNDVTGIFQTGREVHPFADFTEKGFVFAPFATGKYCFIPAEAADIIVAKWKGSDPSSIDTCQPAIDPDAKTAFEALAAKSIAAIREGKFEKLVISRKEGVTHGGEAIDIFKSLLAAYPTAFRYCFYHPDSGLWMGATPEQLLKVENTTLHTVALAGTQLYNNGEEVVWEDKERQEQEFVTDYIVGSLRYHSDNIVATAPYTHRAGNIVHIKTDITAEIGTTGLKDIVRALHPTPAVCGLPKEEAMAFLLENEGYDREYYSGFLGEVSIDIVTGQPKTDLFVNLRCMKVEDDMAHLYIGCGITKDSDPEKEFIETVNKSMTMRSVLATK